MIGLVLGLGNPGPRYRGTRHNAGFDIVDRLGGLLPSSPLKTTAERECRRAELPSGGAVFLVKPQTFMNLSGGVLGEFRNESWFGPAGVLVCYDDIDLPLGQLRIRLKGSAGGHKGMLSCLQALGSQEVPRLRIGVGPVPEAEDAAEFVLRRFAPPERAALEPALDRAAEAALYAVTDGVEAAMNRYNTRPA